MIESAFKSIAGEYTENEKFIAALWSEIEAAHTAESRQYHNLMHLENLYRQLEAVRNDIDDWESIVLAIAYHDFIYNELV
ncbi:MAG: hypothetical protein ACXWEY_14135 [Bacteroidia bacterium]